MVAFSHSLARIAVWNLAGFNPVNTSLGIPASSDRVTHQIEGLALLDAELITLVEVSPIEHIDRLALGLADKGLDYQVKILPQPNGNIHIGFLHKPGVSVTGLQLIDGSEGNDPRRSSGPDRRCRGRQIQGQADRGASKIRTRPARAADT